MWLKFAKSVDLNSRSRRVRAILQPVSESTIKELHIGTKITPIKEEMIE